VALRVSQRALAGHSRRVNGVALSGDGRRAVSASDDNTLKVWDVESGRELFALEGHSRRVHGVALSGDGRRAVSASDDKTLKVWDLESGREPRTLEGHSLWVHGVALSGDGRWAVSASGDTTLKLWDLETGQFITNFICDAAALCCGFAGPRRIIAGDALGKVHSVELEE
jgi:WD40 repeat protein